MMKYRYVVQDNGVFDRKRNAYIPEDTGNRMWKEYLTWKESNTPIPIQPSPYHKFDNKSGTWDVDFGLAESQMHKELDNLAEFQRTEIATDYPMLEVIHTRKLAEAERFKAGNYLPVDGKDFPYVLAERDAMRVLDVGATTKSAADRIIDQSSSYDEAMAEIESIRRTGKENISKAKGNLNSMKSSKNASRSSLDKVKDKKDKKDK